MTSHIPVFSCCYCVWLLIRFTLKMYFVVVVFLNSTQLYSDNGNLCSKHKKNLSFRSILQSFCWFSSEVRVSLSEVKKAQNNSYHRTQIKRPFPRKLKTSLRFNKPSWEGIWSELKFVTFLLSWRPISLANHYLYKQTTVRSNCVKLAV